MHPTKDSLHQNISHTLRKESLDLKSFMVVFSYGEMSTLLEILNLK